VTVRPTRETAPKPPDLQAKILLVDDEAGVRRSLSQYLQRFGFQTEAASDGHDALAKLKESHFDIVISDMRMPGLSGEELYWAINQKYPELATRMIFTSGDMSNERTVAFLASCGCTGLEKPYELQTLLAEIERLQNRTAKSDKVTPVAQTT
jgi:DNA-binding NtrC family response regulator